MPMGHDMPRPLRLALLLNLGWLLVAPVQAVQTSASLQSRLIYSDNIDGLARDARSGSVVEVSPVVSLRDDQGRLTGGLDARLRIIRSDAERGDSTQAVSLNARSTYQVVENRLKLQADALVTQENPSAFERRSAIDTLNVRDDRTVRSVGLSPQLDFRIGQSDATLLYRARWLDADNAVDDLYAQRWSMVVDETDTGRLGWRVEATHERTAYSDPGRDDRYNETVQATLFYLLHPQFRLSVFGGHQRANFSRLDRDAGLVGAGFNWALSPRTALSGLAGEGLGGFLHELHFEHRRAFSAWTLDWTRRVTASTDSLTGFYEDPAYQTLFAASSQIEDPLAREAFVREQLGIAPDALGDRFVSSQNLIERQLRAGFAINGVRNLFRFSLLHTDRERLDEAGIGQINDDFSRFERIRSRQMLLDYSRRLSPDTRLNLALQSSRDEGNGGLRETIRRALVRIGLSTDLGRRTRGAIEFTVQRNRGNEDYIERVLSATLSMRF